MVGHRGGSEWPVVALTMCVGVDEGTIFWPNRAADRYFYKNRQRDAGFQSDGARAISTIDRATGAIENDHLQAAVLLISGHPPSVTSNAVWDTATSIACCGPWEHRGWIRTILLSRTFLSKQTIYTLCEYQLLCQVQVPASVQSKRRVFEHSSVPKPQPRHVCYFAGEFLKWGTKLILFEDLYFVRSLVRRMVII